jgi:hypothetical protein
MEIRNAVLIETKKLPVRIGTVGDGEKLSFFPFPAASFLRESDGNQRSLRNWLRRLLFLQWAVP